MPGTDFRDISPGPSLITTATGTGTIPSSKEREMASDKRRLYLANEEGEGNSGASFLQHQDGGRVPLARTSEEHPNEIPPSYDMISPDKESRPQ